MDQDSCRNFSLDSSSSSQFAFPAPCIPKRKKPETPPDEKSVDQESSAQCSNIITSSSSSSTTTIAIGTFDSQCNVRKASVPEAPNIGYELNVAKSIMQQYSTLSGDNL